MAQCRQARVPHLTIATLAGVQLAEADSSNYLLQAPRATPGVLASVRRSRDSSRPGRAILCSMSTSEHPTWFRHPQRLPWRRLLLRLHFYSGITLAAYIVFISLTGSVLVYRNELYEWFIPYDNAYGAAGMRAVSTLIALHENFLAGAGGRTINGIGASAILLMALSGLVLWWPGVARWRRSLRLARGAGWRRTIWDLHSMVGIWTAGFILMFALSGLYLCFYPAFHAVADWLQPMTEANAGRRLLDDLLYWLAFLHFGRLNGIALPCTGPGLCDQSFKALWALAGLAPAAMALTGAGMWWNRSLRRRVKAPPASPERCP